MNIKQRLEKLEARQPSDARPIIKSVPEGYPDGNRTQAMSVDEWKDRHCDPSQELQP